MVIRSEVIQAWWPTTQCLDIVSLGAQHIADRRSMAKV